MYIIILQFYGSKIQAMASIVLCLGSHKASKYLQRLGFHQKLGWGKLSQVDGKIHFFVTIGYRQLASLKPEQQRLQVVSLKDIFIQCNTIQAVTSHHTCHILLEVSHRAHSHPRGRNYERCDHQGVEIMRQPQDPSTLISLSWRKKIMA